jgi:tetratricopeptide (TPR) repeat protein
MQTLLTQILQLPSQAPTPFLKLRRRDLDRRNAFSIRCNRPMRNQTLLGNQSYIIEKILVPQSQRPQDQTPRQQVRAFQTRIDGLDPTSPDGQDKYETLLSDLERFHADLAPRSDSMTTQVGVLMLKHVGKTAGVGHLLGVLGTLAAVDVATRAYLVSRLGPHLRPGWLLSVLTPPSESENLHAWVPRLTAATHATVGRLQEAIAALTPAIDDLEFRQRVTRNDAERKLLGNFYQTRAAYLVRMAERSSAHVNSAIADLSRAIALEHRDPVKNQHASFWETRGRLYEQLEEYDTALTNYERALSIEDIAQKGSNDARRKLNVSLGICHLKLQNLPAALNRIEVAKSLCRADDPVALGTLFAHTGWIHLGLDDPLAARLDGLAAEAMLSGPCEPWEKRIAHLRLVDTRTLVGLAALHLGPAFLEEAEWYLKRAADPSNNAGDIRISPRPHDREGSSLVNGPDSGRSDHSRPAALADPPWQPSLRAVFGLAMVYMHQSRLRQAETLLRLGLELSPSDLHLVFGDKMHLPFEIAKCAQSLASGERDECSENLLLSSLRKHQSKSLEVLTPHPEN